jgi:GNAT superfamily N-acetyltransferase
MKLSTLLRAASGRPRAIPSSAPVQVACHGPAEAAERADELGDLYARDFVDEPLRSMPFYSKQRFIERLTDDYIKAPNFRIVIARSGDRLVGFAYGCTLPSETIWWTNVIDPLPDELTRETGDRTFVVIDLLVARPMRGRGVAARLHTKLLEGRAEERVTLLSSPSQQPAYDMWLRWGYHKVGDVRPARDSNILHVFLKPLRPPN